MRAGGHGEPTLRRVQGRPEHGRGTTASISVRTSWGWGPTRSEKSRHYVVKQSQAAQGRQTLEKEGRAGPGLGSGQDRRPRAQRPEVPLGIQVQAWVRGRTD